ncbi:hypothetical protein B7494_g2727 [Chlorociboria aeruginascens]|nr:hypothetical protein B7494_g2727 [Chlorociboria aeruginascens]
MDFYLINLLIFIILNTLLTYLNHISSLRPAHDKETSLDDARETSLAANKARSEFKWRFLPVYLLVFGADWLQGPYIYTMYKDQKSLSESTVAQLFTTGFFSAALSATFVGALADTYGRRLSCLCFCVSYSLSCLSILSSNLPVLFAGRMLGGMSTTLMYSVFESWMVTEWHALGLSGDGEGEGELAGMFGMMTTLNGVVAIVAGLVAQGIADGLGTQTAPFMAAVGCLSVAAVVIGRKWGENYGNSAHSDQSSPTTSKNGFRTILDGIQPAFPLPTLQITSLTKTKQTNDSGLSA